MPTKGSINIRDVDKALIQRLKVEAARRGLTLRKYVIGVLKDATPIERETWEHTRGHGTAEPSQGVR